MSRRTSKSASAERRATSRRAVFTVALRPSVPSAACAAASAAWSTSTVVRVTCITVAHLDDAPRCSPEKPLAASRRAALSLRHYVYPCSLVRGPFDRR